jgi:hypothetical protein
MTTTTTPDVPLPEGCEADIWEGGGRVIRGPLRGVDGYDVIVWTAAWQFVDGRIDVAGNVEAPNVDVENHEARGMASAQLASWPPC